MNEDPGLLGGLLYAVKHATQRSKWVVVVVPSGETLLRAQKHFSAIVPFGASFSGRTALVGEGKISLVSADTEAFVPEDAEFSVMFLGWGITKGAPNAPQMEHWRKAATDVLALDIS